MAKPSKNPKHIANDQKKTPETEAKKSNISDAFLDELKGAFVAFDKIPDHDESRRAELYGSKEYLEQFWEYFVLKYPTLLDKIDKKDLPVYIEALKEK